MVQLREKRRALHRIGERDESEGRRAGNAWARAARMAGRRREALEIQHTDRRVRSYSAVVRVSGMGLGYRGQRSGTGLLEEIRFGNRAEWAHSPNAAEGRRYGDFYTAASTAFPQPQP